MNYRLRPLLLLLPLLSSAAFPQTPQFEVASVKQAAPGTDPNTGSWSAPGIGRFTASHLTLAYLIHLAYNIDLAQIANQPDWMGTNLYDIAAKPEDGVTLTREELRPRLQALLQQRFHLVAHREMRSSRGYALVVAKGGAHLTPTEGGHFAGFRSNTSTGHMRGFNWTMDQLSKYLTPAADFPVVDRTGIAGSYDIGFDYNPKPEDTESALPLLDVALRQATGLELKPEKIPVEMLVVDSVDPVPTAN